jgi:hypothetical protein
MCLREEIKQRTEAAFRGAVALHARWLLIQASLTVKMAGWDFALGFALRIYAEVVALIWFMKLANAIDEK